LPREMSHDRLEPMKILSCLLAVTLFFCVSPAYAQEAAVPVTKTDAMPTRDVPLRADAGLTKAEGQIAEGKYMQALETVGGVLARRPADADAQAYAGYAWMKLGDLKKAAEYFDRAIKYDPQHLGANTYRTELYLEAGDFPRAMEQLQVVRLVCAGMPCGELDRLQAALNAYKAPKKDADAAPEAKPDPNAPVNENK
jgi:tetratricopeptide (TPR) repeat protein